MPAPVLQFKRGNAGVAGTVPALRPGEPAISLNNFDFFIGIDTSVANNKFFGSHRYWGREDGTTSLKLKLVDKDGTNGVHLKAPNTLSGIGTYTLPSTNTIVDGYFLKVATDGTLSWDTAGGTNGTFTNPTLSGITTISGNYFDVNTNADFSGITTFSNTTDNTLGNADTGAVQIDGGLGVNKNVTIGAGLSVGGESYFIGTATFYGGQINLGDSDGDNISVAGEFVSNLVPNATNTYDLGLTGKRWRNAFYSGNVDITGNLRVDGNLSIGGTTVTLLGQDVYIQNKDIILGYTTSITGADASTDDTANHAGVAIASTVGNPLVSFSASGINTLPDTYKQMMWFHSGTLGFSTDAFAFNYGVAIGTTSMASGVRLAVGSGVTISDTAVSASTFYGSLVGNVSSADQVKTVTAGNTISNYYLTFVDSHNGSAANENIYTDDGIYYNPGTNTFTSQYGYFTGNLTVDGTIVGIASTARTINTTGTSDNATYYLTFVDTSGGQEGETLRVGTALSVNASTGNFKASGDLIAGSGYLASSNGTRAMYMYDTTGDVSFQGKIIANNFRSSTNTNNTLTFSDLDASFARNLTIAGITTIGSGVGVTQFSSAVGSGTSTSSVPTSSAVIDYVATQVGNVDLTLGLSADTGGSSTVSTSQTLTISGTANEVETSVSGQTITVGLPNAVVVGTSLSSPTIRTNIIQSQNTGATVLTLTADDAQVAGDLTVSGNLYVNGNTTQVNTTAITVEDRTIELGVVDGAAPSSTTTWDLGVLFNYNSSGAKKSAVIWEQGDTRFKFASVLDSDSNGTDANTPQLSVTTFAPIEIAELWVNNACTGGAQQVIGCQSGELRLQNLVVDAGTF